VDVGRVACCLVEIFSRLSSVLGGYGIGIVGCTFCGCSRDRCVGSARSDSTRLAVNSTTNSGKRGIRTLPREQLPTNEATQAWSSTYSRLLAIKRPCRGLVPTNKACPRNQSWTTRRHGCHIARALKWERRHGESQEVVFRCAEDRD